MKRLISLASLATLALAFGWAGQANACPSMQKQALMSSPQKVAVKVKKKMLKASCQIEMQVAGMACAVGCPPKVIKALKTVNGVMKVAISFKKKTAYITAAKSSCSKAAVSNMIQALKKSAYKGKLVQIAALKKATVSPKAKANPKANAKKKTS